MHHDDLLLANHGPTGAARTMAEEKDGCYRPDGSNADGEAVFLE
jgi:hypothetical protein